MLILIGISGIFFPFTHEPLFDNASPVIIRQFTYCHEYFHGVSVTGEDECNALAFYALVRTDDSLAHISAYLDVLRTSGYLLGLNKKELIEKVGLNTGRLIEFIWKNSEKYKSWFHGVSQKSNDLYLKSLGSEEGVESYNGYLEYLEVNDGEITLFLKKE